MKIRNAIRFYFSVVANILRKSFRQTTLTDDSGIDWLEGFEAIRQLAVTLFQIIIAILSCLLSPLLALAAVLRNWKNIRSN